MLAHWLDKWLFILDYVMYLFLYLYLGEEIIIKLLFNTAYHNFEESFLCLEGL